MRRNAYNDRNEVLSGKRYWAGGVPAAGQQFEYAFDTMGNRDGASSGGDGNGNNLRLGDYAVNGLNQYTTIVTPGYEDIVGMAWVNAAVSVISGGATNGTLRQGEYYRCELALGNGSGPVWQPVAVNASGNLHSGNLLFPPGTQNPVYDLDGNLLSDGLWTNAKSDWGQISGFWKWLERSEGFWQRGRRYGATPSDRESRRMISRDGTRK